MKPTAKQVAHAAGVSVAAVSRAFSPDAPIAPETRRELLAAAERIGYLNPVRRKVQAIAAGTITLVSGDLQNPFYPTVLDALAQRLQGSGRHLLVYALAADANVDAATE